MRVIAAGVLVFFFGLGLTAKESYVNLAGKNATGLDQIDLQFSIGSYKIGSVDVNGEKCAYVNLDGAALFEEKGLPMLPYVAKSIIIPPDADMALEVTGITYKEVGIHRYIPSKGVIYRNQNPQAIPYIFGDIYGKDQWYPEKSAFIGMPYIFRDVRGLVVYFQPFQYNPVKGLLRIAESMTVRVKRTGISTVNVLKTPNTAICPSFDVIYDAHFVNYQDIRTRYTFIKDSDKMIVITASAYKSSMDPFVKWKNQKGIKTDLYEYPSQTGGSGASAVKTFIQSTFTADKITYVLLVGDAADIPSISASGGLSDPSFTKVAGTDPYPDVFVARFCVNSADEATAMVKKALKYEKEPDSTGTWYQKVIGMASSEGSPPDYQWMEDMRTQSFEPYGYTMTKFYQGQGGTLDDFIKIINEGCGWINYMGHGSSGSFGFSGVSIKTSDLLSLTNGDKVPVLISVACNNGEFDISSGDCIAEAATAADGKAMLAYLGSYISQPWTPPQHGQKEMTRLLCSDSCISLGGIVYNGGSKILDQSTTGQYLSTFDTWTLFGDPSIMIITKTPKALNASYPQTVGIGAQTVDVSFGESVSGRACLYSEKSGILGSKIFKNASAASFSITVPADEQTMLLTITARNKMPLIKTIDIQSGPYLRVATPLTGDIFYPGQEISVGWQTGGGANVSNVKIEFSADNGSTYSVIIASTPNTSPYKWTAPDINESAQCLIRVSQAGGSLLGVSGAFSIKQKAQILLDQSFIEVGLKPNTTIDRKLVLSNTGKGLLTYAMSQAGGPAKIVINELYVSQSAIFDGCELWNQGGDIDLSGWKLQWNDNQSSSGIYTFSAGFVFKKGKTLVLMDQTGGTNDSTLYVGKNMSWDKATLECSIALLDKDGKGVDFVRTANNSDPAPTGTSWNGTGITLDQDYVGRQSNSDNDNAADWKGSATGTINGLNAGQTPVSGGGWLSFTPKQGTVAALGAMDIALTFNAAGLANGVYYDTLFITHNDPDKQSPIQVPCKLTVDPGIGIIGGDGKNPLQFTITYVPGRGNGGAVYFTINTPAAKKELKVFDCFGSVVYEDTDGEIGPWYFTGRRGGKLSSGVYVAVVTVKHRGQTIQLHKRIVDVR